MQTKHTLHHSFYQQKTIFSLILVKNKRWLTDIFPHSFPRQNEHWYNPDVIYLVIILYSLIVVISASIH